MAPVHPVITSASERSERQSIVAVVCAYACCPAREADRSWAQALELADAGLEVWLVTSSRYRSGIERAVAALKTAGSLHVLFWDAPAALAWLERSALGSRLHAWAWYRIVGRAITDWQSAVGIYALRRVVHRSRASVSFLAMPAVRRSAKARLSWRALWD